jgi:hypothetical protein
MSLNTAASDVDLSDVVAGARGYLVPTVEC